MMEIPRHWRLKAQRYRLEGSRCPSCGQLMCRLAGFAYIARFEWLLNTIEEENYLLRPQYSERKRIETGLRMGLSTLSSLTCRKDFCFRNLLHDQVALQGLLGRIRDLNQTLISVNLRGLSTQDCDKEKA